MKIHVYYDPGSRAVRVVAEAMGEAFRQRGHTCQVFSIADADPLEARRADLICVGSKVKSTLLLFRLRPTPEVLKFVRALPDLYGKQAAVFCIFSLLAGTALGILGNALEARGAFVSANFEMRAPVLDESFQHFVNTVKKRE